MTIEEKIQGILQGTIPAPDPISAHAAARWKEEKDSYDKAAAALANGRQQLAQIESGMTEIGGALKTYVYDIQRMLKAAEAPIPKPKVRKARAPAEAPKEEPVAVAAPPVAIPEVKKPAPPKTRKPAAPTAKPAERIGAHPLGSGGPPTTPSPPASQMTPPGPPPPPSVPPPPGVASVTDIGKNTGKTTKAG